MSLGLSHPNQARIWSCAAGKTKAWPIQALAGANISKSFNSLQGECSWKPREIKGALSWSWGWSFTSCSLLWHQLWSWLETRSSQEELSSLSPELCVSPLQSRVTYFLAFFYSNCWTKACNQIICAWWVLNSISCSIITVLEVSNLVNSWLDTVGVTALPVNISN